MIFILMLSLLLAGQADSLAEAVNQVRAEMRLSSLAPSPALERSASGYARQMAAGRFFGHGAPDGSTLVTRDEAAGYRDWAWLGETLAAGYAEPRSVLKAWLDSPPHRAVLLADALEIGIGHAYLPGSPYGHYWVLEVARSNGRDD